MHTYLYVRGKAIKLLEKMLEKILVTLCLENFLKFNTKKPKVSKIGVSKNVWCEDIVTKVNKNTQKTEIFT